MNSDYIIDKINIKTLPEIISTYMRDNNSKKYNNARAFYNTLLTYLDENFVDSYLNRILKYLSSDEESTIHIFEDINEGVFDDNLRKFCRNLCTEINKYEGNKKLYEKLNSSTNRIYFDYQEFVNIKDSHNDEEYEKFIFYLLKHAFEKYKINTPNITAKRICSEALILDYDTEERKKLIKLSSDLDNQEATLLYASNIYKENPNLAAELYLKCKTLPEALWKIAYLVENKLLNAETIVKVKQNLKDIISDSKVLSDIVSTDQSRENKNLVLAVQIYDYCAKKYTFPKAMCRVGELLISNKILYKDDEVKTTKLAKDYLNKAIKLGNIDAVTIMAIHYNKNKEEVDYDEYLENLYFEISAKYGNPIGCRYYGEILFEKGKTKEAVKYYTLAAEKDEPISCYHLGKYYEMYGVYPEAIKYYKKAISLKKYCTVIELANLYYYLSNLEDNVLYKNMAKSLVEYYYKYLTSEEKEKAKKFLEEVE